MSLLRGRRGDFEGQGGGRCDSGVLSRVTCLFHQQTSRNSPMKITPRLDYEAIVRGRAEVVHLAIQFKAAKREDEERGKPIAFCVVIDNSGSMQGMPLEYAKRAGQLVVKH